MKVLKNINNNICLCLDSKGRELIAFGKGIGFVKPPHDIPLSRINRTFYDIGESDYLALKDIPIETLNVAIHIIDTAGDELGAKYPSSAIFSLADHINFAIQRQSENIYLDMPIVQDLKQLYPKEMELAVSALKYINYELHTNLQRNEAGTLALHLINDREQPVTHNGVNSQDELEECTIIIEQVTGVFIDRDSFNYSRFATHFDYMMKRLAKGEQVPAQSNEMLEILKEKYPINYQSVLKIAERIGKDMKITISEAEILYLLIYVNRLCIRETVV